MTECKVVQDHYEIDEERLANNAKHDRYWERCLTFYEGVKGRMVDTLTKPQREWLETIEEKLND